MPDLFAPAAPAALDPHAIPLAERLRPASLDQVIGQPHLLGPGKPLRLAFASGQPHSMILWGPPGVGKTTLARLMAGHFQTDFIQISAVLAGVKEIREAVERARANKQAGRRTILFVDEVHRFNKAQQDAFLPHVESGLVTFIGATTENPSFEVVGALLSRAQVYVLRSLEPAELADLLQRALEQGGLALQPDQGCRDLLLEYADGDARRLLNLIEQLDTAARASDRTEADAAFAAEALAPTRRRFDKGGDTFYDQISALHKSVRGSNPDASLYWFMRMLDGGADPLYLARRLIRMASEDIGLADPRALTIALDATAAYERLGSPEGELALAEAVLYLACAPKSNAAYMAVKAAQRFISENGSCTVPVHLRNAPTRLMKELGFGREYRYAHDEPEAYAAGETYFPDEIARPPRFYAPTERGLEGKIGEKLAHLAELDRRAGKRR
ncbi:MAG: replication-associated recombination protein A [Betaproteobacteria bacterium]|nr:replication-associated recombination protein A [Betaproteobacteria bacterium]